MKKFRDMTPSELDTIESVYKNNLKKINSMIDLLCLRPREFKKVFENQFEDNIKNRRNYLKKIECEDINVDSIIEAKKNRIANSYFVSTEIASKLLK